MFISKKLSILCLAICVLLLSGCQTSNASFKTQYNVEKMAGTQVTQEAIVFPFLPNRDNYELDGKYKQLVYKNIDLYLSQKSIKRKSADYATYWANATAQFEKEQPNFLTDREGEGEFWVYLEATKAIEKIMLVNVAKDHPNTLIVTPKIEFVVATLRHESAKWHGTRQNAVKVNFEHRFQISQAGIPALSLALQMNIDDEVTYLNKGGITLLGKYNLDHAKLEIDENKQIKAKEMTHAINVTFSPLHKKH